MRISARQIELFRMAYRHRSTRRAAEALHISQPAISRVVSELETEIGVALFDRSGRKFEPTLAAHSLYQSVQRHYHGLERIRETADQIASGTGGHLRVAAVPAVADRQVAAAAGRLMHRYEALRIDIDVLNEQAALSALRDGSVDCAVISSDPGDQTLACTRLADIQPVVILPPGDPSVGCAGLSAAELATVPQIMLPVGSPFRRAVETMFDRDGVSFRVRAEARTQTAVLSMVGQGAGRAVVDRAIADDVLRGDASVVPLLFPLNWPIRFVTLSATRDIPGLQRLISELMAVKERQDPPET